MSRSGGASFSRLAQGAARKAQPSTALTHFKGTTTAQHFALGQSSTLAAPTPSVTALVKNFNQTGGVHSSFLARKFNARAGIPYRSRRKNNLQVSIGSQFSKLYLKSQT